MARERRRPVIDAAKLAEAEQRLEAELARRAERQPLLVVVAERLAKPRKRVRRNEDFLASVAEQRRARRDG